MVFSPAISQFVSRDAVKTRVWSAAVFHVALMAVVCGCRGSDTTPPTFGSACRTDDDCKAPFTCIGGQATPHSCSMRCIKDGDCPRYHWSPPCTNIDRDVQAECRDEICHAFIACQVAPDSGAEAEGLVTTVSHQKEIGLLNPTEIERFCADIDAFLKKTTLPNLCRADAIRATAGDATQDDMLSDADLVDHCRMHADECVSSFGRGAMAPGQDAQVPPESTCDVSAVHKDCKATVGEYLQCLIDANAAYEAGPSCNDVTRALLAGISASVVPASTPPSCAAIESCRLPADGGVD